MSIRTTAGALVSGLALTLGTSLGLTSTADATPDDAPSTPAQRALANAQAALEGQGRAQGVTMALRDLWLNRGDLRGADAEAARSILSRPTTPGDDDYYGDGVAVETACDANICLHWTEEATTGGDQATPAFAADALEAMGVVAQQYIDAGYKTTLPDEGQGGSTLPDIYLANIGVDGLYGYCTTDASDFTDGRAVYAYCVLDNDYSAAEFPTNTPLGNLQVTAAHEYFHAVQFAYDATDDAWIYEAPATWAEDEVYDDVNDNWNYLPYGQLGDPAASAAFEGEGPGVSLDLGDFPYGNWIFFRYLSENHPAARGGMPTIVRDIWRSLDTTGGKPNRYSLEAVTRTLEKRGTTMRKQYGNFAVRNNTPALTYEEGENYPDPAYAFKRVRLSQDKLKASKTVTLDHLTSGTGAFVPFATGYKLKVAVDMTAKKTGSMAAVAVYRLDGSVDRSWLKLNKKGKASKRVPFGSDKVARVEVTVVNASTKMKDCGSTGRFSCGGVGRFENQKQKIMVKAVR